MTPSRQMLMWSVPSIAVILGIFWLRKKRDAKCDPGGRERMKNLREELAEAFKAEAEALKLSPVGKVDRAVIKSAPIDIVPNGSSSQRSSPLQLTDEEVDIEIEKICRKKSFEKEKKTVYENSLEICNDKLDFQVTGSPTKPTNSLNDTEKSEDIAGTSCSFSASSQSILVENFDSEMEKKEDCVQTDRQDSELEEVMEVTPVADNTELNNNLINEPSDSNNDSTSNGFSSQQSRHMLERDSANHSPMDPMLASPSMCHFSDNHSEVRFLSNLFYIINMNT